jgi:plasmid maintenance system antidote protein VapI
MPSYQISLTPHKRAAGRFIAMVRREIQKALAQEQSERGTTQASIAADLGVNRSVIHRQIMGYENLTLGTVGEIASALGREPVFLLQPQHAAAGCNANIQTGTNPEQVEIDGKARIFATD